MRTASITRAILFFSIIAISAQPRWAWFPANTNEASGIKFYFDDPTREEAEVEVKGTRSGEPFTILKTINTSSMRGDAGFLPFETGDLDYLKVTRITIIMGGAKSDVKEPKTGRYYYF